MNGADVLTHVGSALSGVLGVKVLDFARVLLGKREQSAPAAETERAEITARHRAHEVDATMWERRIVALEATVDNLRQETITAAREAARVELERAEREARLEGTVDGLTRKVQELQQELEFERELRTLADANNRVLFEENERLRKGGS